VFHIADEKIIPPVSKLHILGACAFRSAHSVGYGPLALETSIADFEAVHSEYYRWSAGTPNYDGFAFPQDWVSELDGSDRDGGGENQGGVMVMAVNDSRVHCNV
jgi:hypothetical protein